MARTWDQRARGALTRYRVMAYVTGVMLLVLTVELLAKYVLPAPDALVDALGWVPFAHGWIYVLYLVTVLDLWSLLRWDLPRLVTMVLAGVVPVMSFVLERRVHADAGTRIAAGRPTRSRSTAATPAPPTAATPAPPTAATPAPGPEDPRH